MNALEIRNVHACYGNRSVLRGVSLTVPMGEWACLLGPNGVGKSTLLQCISGHVIPNQGSIRIAGCDSAGDAEGAKRALGFACVPEQLPGLLTARQCVEVYAAAKGVRSLESDVLTLAEELRFTPYWDHYVDTLSLGTRQKLCVLLGLIGQPKLIVLDEAFNGLDPRSALTLKHEIKRRLELGAAVLLATHSLDIVEHYATRAALMIDGRIVREWDRAEMNRLRGSGEFEAALAESGDS